MPGTDLAFHNCDPLIVACLFESITKLPAMVVDEKAWSRIRFSQSFLGQQIHIVRIGSCPPLIGAGAGESLVHRMVSLQLLEQGCVRLHALMDYGQP